MKIDFHIHTVKNEFLDSVINFDLNTLITYVKENGFSAIAITNHNIFDKGQFLEIIDGFKSVDCSVFPGIEISLEGGHILVIGDSTEETYTNLEKLSKFVKSEERDDHYKMKLDDFLNYVKPDEYLLIPHYRKDPKIPDNIIEKLGPLIFVGEAQSSKKFANIKKEGKFTPVLFSDIRITKIDDKEEFSRNFLNVSRYTYLKCDTSSFKKIKEALRNKKSTSLTSNFENDFFEIMNGTSLASTGINVLLGKRSSGKTFTLDHLYGQGGGNVLYIRQFDIVRKCEKEKFEDFLKKENDADVAKYCKELNDVFDFINELSPFDIEKDLEKYITSLIESARQDLDDVYSASPLFQNKQLAELDNQATILYKSFDRLLSSSGIYAEKILKEIPRRVLINLYFDFLKEAKSVFLRNKLIEKANNIGNYVGQNLEKNSTKIRIKEIDFKKVFEYRYSKFKFDNLINKASEQTICTKPLFGKFVTEIVLKRQKDKRKLKSQLKAKGDIGYLTQESPYIAYFKAKKDDRIGTSFGDERYKLFFSVNNKVKTTDGFELSGGQKAEFILLSTLENYHSCDLILIDEMESSFDNPFLNNEIVNKIKEMSQEATVFVSTHNNNLGVSLNPDYYIYHSLEIDESKGVLVHKKYYGSATSEKLIANDGSSIALSNVLISTMEANASAYEERKRKYENS